MDDPGAGEEVIDEDLIAEEVLATKEAATESEINQSVLSGSGAEQRVERGRVLHQ